MVKNKEIGKTTFIFGAGASAGSDFKLPCMKGFFKREFLDKYDNLKRFINDYFSNVPYENLNLEEVITNLELSCDQFGEFGGITDNFLLQAKYELSNFIYNQLNYLPNEGRKFCNKHVELLRKINPTDTLISLNYDLILEYSLIEAQGEHGPSMEDLKIYRLGKVLQPFQFRFHNISPLSAELMMGEGHFLKLHGSLNWFYCPQEGCMNNKYFSHTNDINEIREVPINALCNACGKGLQRVIVPPTMNKVFKQFPKMGLLWSIAHREIMFSQRIIMIGISLAESDYYFRWLLKSATSKTNPEVIVVNSDSDIISKVEQLFAYKFDKENYFFSLDNYLNKITRLEQVT